MPENIRYETKYYDFEKLHSRDARAIAILNKLSTAAKELDMPLSGDSFFIIFKNGKPVAGIEFTKVNRKKWSIYYIKSRDPKKAHYVDMVLKIYEMAEKEGKPIIEGDFTAEGQKAMTRLRDEIRFPVEILKDQSKKLCECKIIVSTPSQTLRKRIKKIQAKRIAARKARVLSRKPLEPKPRKPIPR